MLRIRNLSNQYQKRTIRPVYGQTQATPYAAVLDPALRDNDGSFVAPTTDDTNVNGLTYAGGAPFTYQGGFIPGTVVTKSEGESILPHNGVTGVRPWGLLANFVGGTIDDLGDENYVGVWYGKDSVYEILAPAFNDDGLSVAYDAATAGNPVPLYAGLDSRLTSDDTNRDDDDIVGFLYEYNPSKILVKLNV